jgi:hypothetical protein
VTAVGVEVENFTGRKLVVEHRWEGIEDAEFVAPEGARPRIVITLTNLDPSDDV